MSRYPATALASNPGYPAGRCGRVAVIMMIGVPAGPESG